MLPASEYSLARWKNTSTSWSSSRMATFVSWRFDEITSSLLMKTPVHGRERPIKRTEGLLPSFEPGDPGDRFPSLLDLKTFGPLGAEMRFSTPFEALDQNTGESKDAGPAAERSNFLTLNLLESRPCLDPL